MLKVMHKKYLSRKTKLPRTNLKTKKGKMLWSSKAIPFAALSMLTGVLTISGFIPVAWISTASAAEQSSNGTAAYSGNLNLTANVTEPGLSVTLPNGSNATLNLAPPFEGYSNDSTAVTVAVGSHSNYKLYMSGDTNLTDGSGHNIPTLSNCSSGCPITDNTNFANAWGYAIKTSSAADFSNYYGLQTAASTIDNAGTGSGSSTTLTTYQIKFGAKVDHTVTPGTYTGTVNFIAVADVNSNIYMQYMTNDQCTTTASTVYDVRDGKSYKIQKLADNKCWMLDNLALDPTNSNTIVNEYNTNASATTLAAMKNGASSVEGLDNTSGKYASSVIVANPNTAATAGLWGPTIGLDSCTAELEAAGSCTDNWTVPRINTSEIPNETNPDNPVAYQYPAWYNDSNYPSYGSYNIGVYYNYCAASAGSYCYGAGNAPETDPKATEDICPSGWRLPTGGAINTTTGNGEFQALYDSGGNNYSNTVGGVVGYGFRAALSAPLSGIVNYSSGAVAGVGTYGRWWSSTRKDGNYMYGLNTNATGVLPADYYYRPNGLTVRCVLQ